MADTTAPAALPAAQPVSTAAPAVTAAALASLMNPDAAKTAEKAALAVTKVNNTKALPIRQYLETTVVPIMMQGMQALVKERPDNPVEWLATYLLNHNPQNKTSAQGSTAPSPMKSDADKPHTP